MTTPLPWTGKLRTPKEIAADLPKQEKWLEDRIAETKERTKGVRYAGLKCRRNFDQHSLAIAEAILDSIFEEKPREKAYFIVCYFGAFPSVG